MKEKTITVLVAVATLFVLIFIGGSCSKPEKAERVLREQGYTEIQAGGWAPFSKGQDDWWGTSFEAKSPSGSNVKGVVSGGFFKGATIRFD